jgi:hypothetical protein
MLRGFVERRISERIPFSAELQIRFPQNEAEDMAAIATDISAGGIQFRMAWRDGFIAPGDSIELSFNLPELGKTLVKGEIRHVRFSVDPELRRAIICGLKFIDLAPETWNYIWKYCETCPDPEKNEDAPAVLKERENVRIDTSLNIRVHMDGKKAVAGTIENIGFGGVKLRVPVHIPEGARIVIKSTGSAEPFHLEGTCIWAWQENPPSKDFSVGIRFSSPSLDQFSTIRELIFTLAERVGQSGFKF